MLPHRVLGLDTRGLAEVVVTRAFKAPRKLVWDAHTKPELLKRWMTGYDGWTMPVCEMDVRVGGKYRWRWRSNEDGKEFGFFGKFREVEAPSKLAHEEYYDPGDVSEFGGSMESGEPALITSEFSESGGVTSLTVTMLFASKQARDGAVATGMTDGMEFSYAQLDEMFKAKAA